MTSAKKRKKNSSKTAKAAWPGRCLVCLSSRLQPSLFTGEVWACDRDENIKEKKATARRWKLFGETESNGGNGRGKEPGTRVGEKKRKLGNANQETKIQRHAFARFPFHERHPLWFLLPPGPGVSFGRKGNSASELNQSRKKWDGCRA